jgi:hypothetical protein
LLEEFEMRTIMAWGNHNKGREPELKQSNKEDSMDLENKVHLHFIVENELIYKQMVNHVPRIGDEIRFTDEKVYTVTRIVWAYDEPNVPCGRANVGLESARTASCADDVKRLTEGLKDTHDRLTGKRGNPKWVVGHIENLLAGRNHWEWE